VTRVRPINDRPVRPGRDYVLYWMISARRTRSSFALDRALERARELGKPLVVLEALRVDYPWASDRLHRFVLDGMADNAPRFERAGIRYYPYVEPLRGAGKGLLAALGSRACAVVTDEFPAFFLPKMVDSGARSVDVFMEQVDGNGLVPLRAPDRVFVTARSFRRWLRENLSEHPVESPRADPLRGARLPEPPHLSREIARRWPPVSAEMLNGAASPLAALPIDHRVSPAPLRGGSEAAQQALGHFVQTKLRRYAAERHHPDADVTSGLSPYLHFGHISPHQIVSAVARHEDGAARSVWGLGENADAFLDQLVTWRELAFNMCARRADYAAYDSLPAWALRTLDQHASDRRPQLYSEERLETARTGDPVWNAAQRQLLREGRIHNYLRMLWGKKILEWSPSPAEALRIMISLNDKYALDGRDPNSYSGILWVLGRYDRPWGPERPIFGLVRYMSSESAVRKLRMRGYLARYGAAT
jgi:deoxyribodipyrimidine photo-lyase